MARATVTGPDDPSLDPSGLRIAAAVEPLRRAIEELVELARDTASEAGSMPAADSVAMAEIAEQAKFAGAWGDTPLEDAQTYASLALFAAEDQLLDICALITPCADATEWRVPVYGPGTLARAVLEAAGRAAYLCDPTIGYQGRVARHAAERIVSKREATKAFPTPETELELEQLTDTTEREATRLGLEFKATDRGVRVGDDWRPGNRKVVELLLGDPDGLALHAYAYYSGIAHGAFWAIAERIDRGSAFVSELNPNRRPVIVDSSTLTTALACAAVGYVTALERVYRHRGWYSDRFDQARQTIMDAIRAVPGWDTDGAPVTQT